MADPDLQCPGREKCLIYLTDPQECSCDGKPNGVPSPEVLRALGIEDLQRSGCALGLNDLAPSEWMSLSALREARAKIAEKARAARERN